MFKFLHHLFSPHCSECRLEQECQSCETLRLELERLRAENDRLLSAILDKPVAVIEEPKEVKPIYPKGHIPWKTRQQMLEKEDREAANSLKKAAKPDSEVEELEKELGVANADQ